MERTNRPYSEDPELERLVGQFDRACSDGLGLGVCPENRWERRKAVRIRTLRTQQRAISQCQRMVLIRHSLNKYFNEVCVKH